jgi:hypothetical protein
VDFVNTRPRDNIAHIVLANPAAGDDRDPRARLID